MKAMEAISRRLSFSDLNTLSYVARSRRIANAVKKGDLFFVDKLPPRDWRQSDWNYEVDRLQYNLAYSNSELYNPEDLLSLSRDLATTAENLEEEARALTTMNEEADRLFDQVIDLRRQADFYYGEAKAVLKEEKYISKWEEIYDMI